ncbi:alpha-L-rhamnosidase [Aspergillus mulundensis]|uniref:alpha-L-rhamnosidase n=1 Tax=Aspergillus mulundensis TaxID=1810919 RepID=A0A3D8RL48_9EURO|nr:Bacterial alpha-L-rhamnosidase protein [Aspergillus mulundensis]RDW74634.1 Bacterial alpha-L-rhamnosidase protein [Aspergillus mulundensis]
MARITNVRFEHYHAPNTLGVEEICPRISWNYEDILTDFEQIAYELEVSEVSEPSKLTVISTTKLSSSASYLVPWPHSSPALVSRQRAAVRVRAWDQAENATAWSCHTYLEVGLLSRNDWHCKRIAAPWGPHASPGPDTEELYRKEFHLDISTLSSIIKARLYITAQGVYEAEINGKRVGDHFMAPGWTAYDGRLQYQTYNVGGMLVPGANCIGVRVAEGWFCGRIGFEGGHRNIWGEHTALLVQMEITLDSGEVLMVLSDGSWKVAKGPIRLAEIYDGEKYDARKEIPGWSSSAEIDNDDALWEPVLEILDLSDSVTLTAGFGEPVRHIEAIKPVSKIITPSGKVVLDFGQNLVGHVHLSNINGMPGDKITLSHAEVLEHGELCTRPLRICKAIDKYILRGTLDEEYAPRFTFHGFRYAQVDGWTGDSDSLFNSTRAIVCHSDMRPAGEFSCSHPLVNKLYSNIVWSMRGNFLSVPTDCPQRDERLGWSGDLALFAPTAVLLYDCFNFLKNWLIDLEHDQIVLGGVPAMVTPNATLPDPVWCRRVPCAIWHDVTILAPWALYEETGDESILAQQYHSMVTWMSKVPRNSSGATSLWETSVFNLGDWLDPSAPPSAPWKGSTDARLVANAFLIHSLSLMIKISHILDQPTDTTHFSTWHASAISEFRNEYITPTGRLVSDSQTAYALAIVFNLLKLSQIPHAADRLVYLVRKNSFCIGTGFAGTPYICEALAQTGHLNVAYGMLLNEKCPSWLYPVTMGATTVWERWDSMLPDGSINEGEMTSFNHYAFGAIARFLYERVAGLRRVEAGWKRFGVSPGVIGGLPFSEATAEHVCPFGTVRCRWVAEEVEVEDTDGEDKYRIKLQVSVPYGTTCEVFIPDGGGVRKELVGPGERSFESLFVDDGSWPVEALPPKS